MNAHEPPKMFNTKQNQPISKETSIADILKKLPRRSRLAFRSEIRKGKSIPYALDVAVGRRMLSKQESLNRAKIKAAK